jgi:hypothetical protein
MASQHPRSKILLSKQTRARNRKFSLRALVRKKKTMKENMMKMKWLYSSRNLTSSQEKKTLQGRKEREVKVKEGVLQLQQE